MDLDNAKPVPDNLTDPVVAVDYRARIIARAESQLDTRDPARYFREAAPCYPTPKQWAGKSWCQIFLLWCARSVGLTGILWQDGGGNFFPALPQIARAESQPGDFTCLPKNKFGSWVWHGALWLRADGHFDESLDGNTSEGVARRRRDVRLYDPRPLYYSIDKLIAAAELRDRTPTEPPV